MRWRSARSSSRPRSQVSAASAELQVAKSSHAEEFEKQTVRNNCLKLDLLGGIADDVKQQKNSTSQT